MPRRPRIRLLDPLLLNDLPMSTGLFIFWLITVLGTRFLSAVSTPLAVLLAIPATLLTAYFLWIALLFLLAFIEISPIGRWIAQRRDEKTIRQIKHRIDHLTARPPRPHRRGHLR